MTRPETVSKVLAARLNAGDVDALEALYEDDAVFADYEGAPRGWSAIKAAHLEFLDSGLSLELDDHLVFETGNIALVHWSWTVHRADGSTMQGISAEVLRRQDDGTWKFVIDNSDGSALLGVL